MNRGHHAGTLGAISRTFAGFGTTNRLAVWPSPGHEAAARRAVAQAVVFLRAAERRLSRFRPRSEISRLNRRGHRWTRVTPLTFDLIRTARHGSVASGGLFDATVLPAVRAAGYDRSFERLARARATARPAATGAAWRPGHVALRRRDRAVRLSGDAAIDLGGVAKGALADRVLGRLERYGSAAVDLGGDLALSHPGEGRPDWMVDVADPTDDRRTLGALRVACGGVATSGTGRRRWQTAAGPRHHLIDPRTGAPARTDLVAVTVIAPTATAAEIAAKTAILLGSEDGLSLLEGAGFAAVLVSAAGAIRTAGAARWTPRAGG